MLTEEHGLLRPHAIFQLIGLGVIAVLSRVRRVPTIFGGGFFLCISGGSGILFGTVPIRGCLNCRIVVLGSGFFVFRDELVLANLAAEQCPDAFPRYLFIFEELIGQCVKLIAVFCNGIHGPLERIVQNLADGNVYLAGCILAVLAAFRQLLAEEHLSIVAAKGDVFKG